MVAFTFSKRERMVSRQLIESLFGGSHSMVAYPVRAVFKTTGRQEGDEPVQLLISVPKKHFKHAVDRNRVKRQLREAFRRHKHLLANRLPADRQLLLAFVWLTNEHQLTLDVERCITKLLQRVSERL